MVTELEIFLGALVLLNTLAIVVVVYKLGRIEAEI